MLLRRKLFRSNNRGFTSVELIVATIVFPIIVIGITTSFNAMRRAYTTARQLNEIYSVLSACPEFDRALEFSSLSTTSTASSCYPNYTFKVEDSTGGQTVSYTPSLTVTDTSSLSPSDPLQSIPDSKVLQLQVNFLSPSSSPTPLQLRMLITRNGIGQL